MAERSAAGSLQHGTNVQLQGSADCYECDDRVATTSAAFYFGVYFGVSSQSRRGGGQGRGGQGDTSKRVYDFSVQANLQ